jgi:hypothetical protein
MNLEAGSYCSGDDDFHEAEAADLSAHARIPPCTNSRLAIFAVLGP